MSQSVGHHKVLGVECHVVARDLVKRLLRNPDHRRLAFDNDQNVSVAVKNHYVVSLGKSVHFEHFLDADVLAWIFFIEDKIVNHMLPHPFLGREDHVFFPDDVKHGRLSVYGQKFKGTRRKIERLHGSKVKNTSGFGVTFFDAIHAIFYCARRSKAVLLGLMKELKTIIDDIKAGRISPIYALMGEEPYYIDRLTEFIEENILTPDEKGFNFTVMYGPDSSVEEIELTCKRYPMMAERQVVIVREAQQLKQIDNLAVYAAKPTPSTVLVLAHKYKSIDKRKVLYKTIKETGVVFESKSPSDREIPDFIERTATLHGFKMDAKAIKFMFECMGNNLSRIAKEIEKFDMALPKGASITIKDIEEQVGMNKDFTIFEFVRALGAKDATKAYKIGQYFVKSKEHSIHSTLPLVANHFTRVLAYHGLKDKSKGAVASSLGIPPFAVDEIASSAQHYPMKTVSKIVGGLRQIDLKGKGVDASLDFEELLKELYILTLN